MIILIFYIMRDYLGKKYNCDWEPYMLFVYMMLFTLNELHNEISDLNHCHEHN